MEIEGTVLNNYYQPPQINQPNFNYNEAAMQTQYYMEKAKMERKEIRHLGNMFGLVMSAYVIVSFICVIVMQALGLQDVYNQSALFQTCFNIVAVDLICIVIPFGILAFTNRKKYKIDIIPTKKVSGKDMYLWVTFGMFCCIGANYIVAIVVTILKALGHDPLQINTPEPDSVITSIAIAIGTAVMPALCEEFAMRCCGLGLLRNHGKAFGVVAVSIVFGLMHGNLIQFVFATLVGLILGYVTVKTDSVLPAVLIHLFNNGMSVVSSIVEHFANTQKADISIWFYLVWMVLGGISAFVLGFKGRFKRSQKTMAEPFQNSTGKKIASFFFVPGMIFPFLYFAVSIITTIR
ncbi:MAG: CPBP family intramembrane metalloprotease [Eubacterium sp.]|nr:CPBP family intramembrane metalloprotease [Eubacterium sp.]